MSLHSINPEIIPLVTADDLYSASTKLIGNTGLVAYWKKAFEPDELELVADVEQDVNNKISRVRSPSLLSMVPIIAGRVLPPELAYGFFAVHQVTAPQRLKLPIGTLPLYPVNAIGPGTFHTHYRHNDMPAHHDGPRRNGGLTVHATLTGNFTASFGRQDFGGILPTRSKVWPVGQSVSSIGLKDGPAVLHGGPGDVLVFAGYGLNDTSQTAPVIHKFTSHDITDRKSAVFDPVIEANSVEQRAFLPVMRRLVDRNPDWAAYPRWQDFLS